MTWLGAHLDADRRWNDSLGVRSEGGFPEANFAELDGFDEAALLEESSQLLDAAMSAGSVEEGGVRVARDASDDARDAPALPDPPPDEVGEGGWIRALDRAAFEPTDEFEPIAASDIEAAGFQPVVLDALVPVVAAIDPVARMQPDAPDGGGGSQPGELVDPFDALAGPPTGDHDPVLGARAELPDVVDRDDGVVARDDIASRADASATIIGPADHDAAIDQPVADAGPDGPSSTPVGSGGSERLDAFEQLDIDPVGTAIPGDADGVGDLGDAESDDGSWIDHDDADPGFDA